MNIIKVKQLAEKKTFKPIKLVIALDCNKLEENFVQKLLVDVSVKSNTRPKDFIFSFKKIANRKLQIFLFTLWNKGSQIIPYHLHSVSIITDFKCVGSISFKQSFKFVTYGA